MNDKEEVQYFQNIFIKLSDGRDIQASVPAFCSSEEELKNLKISEIKITEPREAPKGMSFRIIK